MNNTEKAKSKDRRMVQVKNTRSAVILNMDKNAKGALLMVKSDCEIY
jgi:hypothetical protein